MNREATHNVKNGLVLMGAMGLLALGSAHAQVPVDDNGNPIAAIGNSDAVASNAAPEGLLLSAAELEELVGPVALYPDDLLAVVLPASTFPLEIVQAARYLERHEEDPTLQPDDDWDESIIALLNYPEVLNMLNDDLDWTWKLGEAVVAQQNELIVAVEAFRDRAYAAGNLKSDEYQTVSNNDGIIEIDPVNDDVIYVPYYEPERVVVYSPQPVYHYYPRAYPVYYYPYAAGYSFNSGFFWGVTTAFTIGWATDYLHVYHHSYYGHPYYGYSYNYGNHYWRRPSIHVYNNYYVNNHHYRSHDYYRHGDYWRPRHHGGARPGHQVARNTYYSGSQRSSTRNAYRDGRTDGLAYNSNTRLTTATNRTQRNNTFRPSNNRGGDRLRASNRNSTRAAGVSPSASTLRPAVSFRQRSNNAYTGSVAPRLQRAPGTSSRQSTRRQPAAARNNTRNSNSDAIRFRSRESSANRLRVASNATARQSRRTSTSARTTPTNRMSFAANNSQRPARSTSRRPSAASSSPQVRRSAPARVSSAPRQATVRSQPRRESVSRPASPPRQAQQLSASRPSSPRPSSKPRSQSRSKASAGSSRGSGGSSRSGRKRK